jgi:hypothetical protein
MTPRAMIVTSLMLAAFVLAAGAYGFLYSLGLLWHDRRFVSAGRAAYAVLCAITVAIVALTPLGVPWKLLVAASCAIYFWIPPATWRYLVALHQGLEQHP